MFASQLRHSLIVEERTDPPKQDWDRSKPFWRIVTTIRGSIEEKTGTERLAAAGMSTLQQFKITTRYDSRVKSIHRLRDAVSGEIYNIGSVSETKGKWLAINATRSDISV